MQRWGTFYLNPLVHSGSQMFLLVRTLIIRVFQKMLIVLVVLKRGFVLVLVKILF